MKLNRIVIVGLGVYVAVVVLFEVLVGVMGARQAAEGLSPDDDWIVITTTAPDGDKVDTVLGAVEIDGALYVATNHWPRAWYRRAVEMPDILVTRHGERRPYKVVPLLGEAHDRIAKTYKLHPAIRFLSGFPPRSFLRLDPR